MNLFDDDEDEPITEMALVDYARFKTKGEKYAVSVDSSETRIGEPYFKFYDGPSRTPKTPVARVSFLEPRYVVHHKRSKEIPFVLNTSLRRLLVRFMQTPYKVKIDNKKITNWQFAILQYNLENIDVDDWSTREWLNFTTRWKRKNEDAIIGTDAEHALPIDLPMPNYLLLR